MMGGMRCLSGLGVFAIFVALGYLGDNNRCHPPFDDGVHEVLEWSGGFCDFCGFGLSGLIWSKAWQFVVHLLVRSL